MSTSLHFKTNPRDIHFNLFEFLKIQETSLGKGPFASMDESTAKESLTGIEALCKSVLSQSFVDSDRIPLKLDPESGNVSLPPSMIESFKAYYQGDWHRFDLPEHLGGFGAPPTLSWAAFEWMSGANASLAFYTFGIIMAKTIAEYGTEEQKKRFVPNIIERPWGGTMVLTEPDAGSDVGAGTTKARHLQGDEWAITGVKRFITNGDFDAVENIVHLVLARPEGAGGGTKGLSLFIVPKYWVDEKGQMTKERNGVYCTNIEKKMGIKGSATCEMTFGQKGVARGLLLGNIHNGIAQMFHVIEYARMSIGVKSYSTLSTAYLNALDYTKGRVQGPDLSKMMDKASPRVAIINHPDVRRMLMRQKSYAEGMRALCLWAASLQDQSLLHESEGQEATTQKYKQLVDFLLPIIKGFNSEKTYEILTESLQCFGGSGFCQDYPIEQYIRDQKIDSLYEGTTHIQAMDFYFRKIMRNQGATLKTVLEMVQTSISEIKTQAKGQWGKETELLQEALNQVQKIYQMIEVKSKESVYHVGLQANRVLYSMGTLLIGHLLLQHAHLCSEKLVQANQAKDISEADRAFYKGKMASCSFFFHEFLPEIHLHRMVIEQGNLKVMDLKESEF